MNCQPLPPLSQTLSPKQVYVLDILRYDHFLTSIDFSEPKDEPELLPPVPTRTPASMPVPAGPRRAAPPRKKPAPPTALPEPPVEEAVGATVQSPDGQPPATADYVVHDALLPTRDSQEIAERAEIGKATHDEQLNTTVNDNDEQQPPASIEAFHEPVEEPEKQEAEEELVEGAGSHVEEEFIHTVADSQHEIVDVEEEDEEARRHRVAAKLAQMGAINPLAGPPLISQRPSSDEPAPARYEEPLDVEDEVNVDTEEHGETIPPPPTIRPRPRAAEHDPAESHLETDQDDGKLDEDEQVPAHRDGES